MALYVDDISVWGGRNKIDWLKCQISNLLIIRKPIDASQFLSIRVTKPNSDMVLAQFGMTIAKGLSAPLEVSKSVGIPGEDVDFDEKTGRQVKVFCDSDFANDKVDRKSCIGYVILLEGGAVSWCSKKQGVVPQSTVEAELVSMAEVTKDIAWMKGLLGVL
ncbi:hypothetical protein PR048_011392, partial [Dryococelus australis]